MARRIFSIIFIGLLLPVGLFARPAVQSWVGVYTRNHTGWLPNSADYCPFEGDVARAEIWILCRPGDTGVMGIEFMMDYPDNVTTGTSTMNESIVSVSLGTLEKGISICFAECRTDLFCPIHQTVWINSHDHTAIGIVPYPECESIIIATCEPGYPLEECLFIQALGLNYENEYWGCTDVDEAVGTESSSWGVIKILVDE